MTTTKRYCPFQTEDANQSVPTYCREKECELWIENCCALKMLPLSIQNLYKGVEAIEQTIYFKDKEPPKTL